MIREEIRKRPQVLAAIGLAVLFAGVGLWSCQSGPRAGKAMVPLTSEPEVRIRIKNGAASTKVSGPSELVIQPRTSKPAILPGPLTIAASSTGCTVTDGKGKVQSFSGLEPLEIVPVGEGSSDEGLATRIKVDGVSYPGNIRIVPRGDVAKAAATKGAPATTAKLDVIETIPMETYLAGVVGAELYKDWPETAFKVQAVCARTYALHERERANSQQRDFDLESTTADQAYSGGAHLPVAVKAVSETRGVVVTWQGQLLRAYYSSTCGGRTASAADIWPTGPGYEFNLDAPIQAHHRESACEISPRYRWEAVRDRVELSKRVKEWGRANAHAVAKLGLINLVSITATNVDGRPTTYLIADDQKKTYTIKCEELRQACNQTVTGLPELTKETRVWSSDFEIEVRGAKITIRGRGFGHGVGMCQYCTKAMADRGGNWREIVLGFYPGTKLERAY
jgi:stage II sporulation protein D